MSLRARVLVGSLVIAFLLAGVALIVTRVTEAHLVERVDEQLEPRAVTFQQCGGATSVLLGFSPPDANGSPRRVLGGDAQGNPPPGAETCPPPPEGDADGNPVTAGEPTNTTVTSPESPDTESPESPESPDTEDGGPPARRDTVGGRLSVVSSPLIVNYVAHVTTRGIEPLAQPFDQGEVPTPDISPAEAIAAADRGEPFTTGSMGSDTRWRVRAVYEEDTGQLLVVAQSLDDVDAIIEQLVVIEVVATLAILAALGLVGWWVDRHGIRPVKRMTATATAIAAGDLSHRVPESGVGTEAGKLGAALNRMLGRIETAFDERSRSEARLRRFVADASHELRTPVTTIRGYTELYESGALDDRDDLSEAMRRTGQEAVRMGKLVDDLLLLARLDQGPELARTRVDLAALVADAGRDAQAVDPERRVATRTQGPLDVLGDGDRLRQVLANLVGNALVHTPSSAALDILAVNDGGRAVVEITDHGPGMAPEVAEHAFERFFRADASRSRHRGGSGLGLAIVQACVTAHGGEVRLRSAPGVGTTALVVLPLAAPNVRPPRRFSANSQVALGAASTS